jgi:hypothetical protein
VKLTPHPVIKLPSTDELKVLAEKFGAEKLADILRIREEKIHAEKTDPYRHGYEPFHWKAADDLLKQYQELLVLGGNRAGKTEWAAKRVVAAMVNSPNARVWCLHTTSKSSIEMQQNIIWKYIPPEFKTLKKGRVTNVQYSQKNGFSDGTNVTFLIMPKKSELSRVVSAILSGATNLSPWIGLKRYVIVSLPAEADSLTRLLPFLAIPM